MRADERQAAAAYAYAWWMTGDDDAAAAALRHAIGAPDPAEDSDEARLVALMSGVRGALGDARPMPPPSELALLHDGFDVPLETAAELALVPPADAATQLADGRLEALLETVREDFRHPERLGGLALGDADDIAHAQECRSCGRAAALIERGRAELREVSSVSAPPGLIGSLVAEFAPPEPAADEVAAGDTAVDAAPAADEVVLDTAAPVDVDVVTEPPAAAAEGVDATPVEAEPLEAEPVEERTVEAEPVAPAPVEEPEEEAPVRRGLIGVLVAGGLLTACVLVAVLVASGGEDPQPAVDPPATPATTQPSSPPRSPGEETEPPFGPDGGEPRGFTVVQAGLLLSGEDGMAPSATRIGPEEPLRVAVDYENGSKGVRLDALWRVNDEIYQRLHAVVSAKASRHVWGLPVPEDGWPPGRHRIVVTADDSVAAAIDFTVRKN